MRIRHCIWLTIVQCAIIIGMQDQMRLNSSTVLYTDTIMQQTIEKAKQEVRQESQEIIQAFEAQKGASNELI